MLTLYKHARGGLRYWEAWEFDGWVAVHEGKVGERGKTRTLSRRRGKTPEQVIVEVAEKPRAKGYAEIPIEEQHQVVVQYQLKTWGSAKDLDKAHKIEDLFNECLGWTGNGFCDGNDIGSGSMNIFSIVVDPHLAVQTMIAELKRRRLLKGAVIAVRKVEGEEEDRVVHPPDFEGEFSLL
jgi:hypothetical protein